jgi:hypothetical protein
MDPDEHSARAFVANGRGRCSVAQTTGITVAAEFENFEQSDSGK